jgi:adenylate cyclase
MSVVLNSEADAVIANPLRANGLVDPVAMERARAYARERGGSLADALLRLNLVKEGDFLRVFAELYSTRFVKAEKLRTLKLDEALLDRVSVRTAERLRMCPIRWDPALLELHVVAGIPLSSSLEPELRQAVGARTVTVYVATTGAVAALVNRAYYRKDDAFDEVTPNAAGPTLRPRQRTPIGDSTIIPRELVETPVEVPAAAPLVTLAPGRSPFVGPSPVPVEAPRSQPGDNQTVMVNLEALTIATLRRENARYRIAQEFHRRVSLERSVETMVERILSVIFELLPADGAAVWLKSGQYSSKCREGSRRIEVPRAIVDQALGSQGGVLTHNALMDERFDRSHTVVSRGVKSVMAVPLRTRSATIGILYVESLSMSAAFTEEDLPLLDSIAAQASLLLDNAALVAQVQREMETRAGLSRFLSQAAVDEVLSGRLRLNLEGQSTELTVLFADIRGFTALAAHLRPEEVVRFLNAFFAEAVDAVERHGGIVDKFVGDCVMASWGAVKPSEDDARNAIRAALEMVERGGRIRVKDSPLKMGVGLNTGSAVVGAIGSKKRLDYTAIGATVNLAARLCAIAEPQEVLITAETLMRAGAGVMSDAGPAVLLKGFEIPVVPYRVRGLYSSPSGVLPRTDPLATITGAGLVTRRDR